MSEGFNKCLKWTVRIAPCIALLGIVATIVAVIETAPGPASTGGAVNVTFRNNGTSGQGTQKHGFLVQVANGPQSPPVDIEMKFLAIYLWTDYDTVHFKRVNNDVAPLIWQNPECAGIADCNTNDISSFFNFTQSLAAINREINSQNRGIPPGTYRYIQMEMCRHNLTKNGTAAVDGTDPNFRFLAGKMNHTFSVVSNNCGIWSTRAEPPIVIAEGSIATVHLDFDLDHICAETECTAPRMAHQPPHDVGGHIYNCVQCDVPVFHISLGQIIHTKPPHHSSSTGIASSSSSSTAQAITGGESFGGGSLTGTGAGIDFKVSEELREKWRNSNPDQREFNARFPH